MMANKITPISETDRNALKRKTAAVLPDNPAACGMKAAQVKPKFWQALVDGDESVAGLINRLIGEANKAFAKAVEQVSYDPDTEKITLTFGDGSTEPLDCPKQGPTGAPGRDGADGISPTVETARVEGGYRITVTDANGPSTFILPDGAKGETGDPFRIAKTYTSVGEMNAGFATDEVPEGGFVLIATGSVEDADNAKLFVKGETGYQYLIDLSGATGIKGDAGNSIKSIAKTGSSGLVDTYTVTLTDGSTYPFTVTNGRDGTNGQDGADGKDGKAGVSPTVSVTQIATGHTVQITDASGTKTFTVTNGRDGTNGQDGADGKDGVSPTVSVTQIATGHTVQITDASGTKTFTVKDGERGDSVISTVTATSHDGIIYTGTLEGLEKYENGMLVVFIPNMANIGNDAYFGINDLDLFSIRIDCEGGYTYQTNTEWIKQNKPILLMLSEVGGIRYWAALTNDRAHTITDKMWFVDRLERYSRGNGTVHVELQGEVNATRRTFHCVGSFRFDGTTSTSEYYVLGHDQLNSLLRENTENVPYVSVCKGKWWAVTSGNDIIGYGTRMVFNKGSGIMLGRAYLRDTADFGAWPLSNLMNGTNGATVYFEFFGEIS